MLQRDLQVCDITCLITLTLSYPHPRHGAGKVLLHSINIKTESCDGCSQDSEGARLRLMGEVVGEALPGYPCFTNILDTELVTDYSPGSVASFDAKLDDDTEDTTERRSMGSCYKVGIR